MDIHRLPSVEEVEEQAAKKLEALFKTYERQDVLFLTSGGSAMRVLDLVDVSDARQVTLSVLDERYSRDADVNNYLLLAQTDFYSDMVEKGAHVIKTVPDVDEELEAFGDRMERQLRNWRLAHKNGIIIATIGMGADGHTVGIFPYPDMPDMFKDSFLSEQWVYAYSAVDKNEYEDRATTTMTFLKKELTHAVAVIHGEQKQEALVRAMEGEGTLAETPARILQAIDDVYLYTDL